MRSTLGERGAATMDTADELAMVPGGPGPVGTSAGTRPQGRREVFDSVFAGILPRLYRAAVLLTGGGAHAQDLVHDAYLKICRRPERFLAHPEPYAYAFTAVANLARDQWRRNRRQLPAGEPTDDWYGDGTWPGGGRLPNAAAGEDALMREHQDGVEVVRLLRRLTFKQARSVLLVDVEGYTIDEAAQLIRTHRSTVAITRRRGLERLRSLIEQERAAEVRGAVGEVHGAAAAALPAQPHPHPLPHAEGWHVRPGNSEGQGDG